MSALHATDYRHDIDGLRALAVLSVVIYHAFPWLIPGGFIGVDIFFVISGYLISTIIFKGLERKKFSFLDFYMRRIRRIFPTLIFVLLICLILGWFLLTQDEFLTLSKHIFFGSLFSSNYILYRDINYFDTLAELKPLLHLWSLAIEEQFYIIWPITMWLLWKINNFKLTFIICTALISFLLNIFLIDKHPALVFYMPFTRFWELQIGCILAYLTLYHPLVLKRSSANIQAFFGYVLIFIALFVINKTRLFPGAWALLPTFGAALLINSGMNSTLNRALLGNPFMVTVGLISYPLYLWHWPLLSFTYLLEHGQPLISTRLFDIMLAFLLAYLSYEFLEKKLRFGEKAWLKTFGLTLGMACIVSFALIGFKNDGFPQRYEKPTTISLNERKFSDSSRCPLPTELRTLPDGCGADKRSLKDPDTVIIGDSHAITLYDGFLSQAKKEEAVAHVAHFECPPLRGVVANFSDKCLAFNDKALSAVAKNPNLKTIILTTFHKQLENYTYKLKTDPEGKLSQEETLTNAFSNTIGLFIENKKRVVFVIDNPAITDSPEFCIKRHLLWIGKEPYKHCELSRAAHEASIALMLKIAANLKQLYPQLIILNPIDIMCDEQKCSTQNTEGWALYSYTQHISDYAAGKIALFIKQALQ